MKIPKIIAKIMLYRSCYSILVFYEFKLLSKYPTISSFYLWLFCLAVAAIHFHSKELFFNFKREWFCLQSLNIRINIYFDWICRDDTITWKKFILERRASLFVKATSRLWKTSCLAETRSFLHVIRNFFFSENTIQMGSHINIPTKRHKFPHIISLHLSYFLVI